MIIQSYLYKEISRHFIVILSFLVGIFLFMAYLHFLDEIANSTISSNTVSIIMLTEIPILLQPIIPLSFYLATLLVFQKMRANNEILSIYALGISKISVFIPVIILSILLTLLTCYIQFYVYPHANYKRIHIYEDAIHESSIEKFYPYQFNQFATSGVIYFEKSEDTPQIKKIFFSRNISEKKNIPAYDVILADSLEEKILPDKSKFVVFKDGTRYVGKFAREDSEIIDFQKYSIRLTMPDYRLEDWPGSMDTMDLYLMSKIDRYAAAEFHWRISIPISVMILTLLAIVYSVNKIRDNTRLTSLTFPIIIYVIYINLILTGMGLIKNENIRIRTGLWWVHALILIIIFLVMSYHHFSFFRVRK